MNFSTFSYSIDLAKIFGINSAVFITYLDMEHKRDLELGKEDGYTVISVDSLFNFTGLSQEKQLEVETALIECGVLLKKKFKGCNKKVYFKLDYSMLSSILNKTSYMCDLIVSAPKVKVSKTVNKLTKTQQHVLKLKKCISLENEILKQYMCDWIDAVYTNPKGFLSESSIKIAEDELTNFSSNVDKLICILKIAIKGGYRDMTWAINRYNQECKTASNNFASYNNIKSDGSNESEEVF